MSSSSNTLQHWMTSPSTLPPCPRPLYCDPGLLISSSPSISSRPHKPSSLRPHRRSKSLSDLRSDLAVTFPTPFSLERDLGSAFASWTPLWKSVHVSATLTFQVDTIPSLRAFNEASRKFNWLVIRLRSVLALTEFMYEFDVWSKEDITKFPTQDGVTAMFIVQGATAVLDEVAAGLQDVCRAKRAMTMTWTMGSWYAFREQQLDLGEKLPAWAYSLNGYGWELERILKLHGIATEVRPKDLNFIGGLQGWERLIKTPTWIRNLSLRASLCTEKVLSHWDGGDGGLGTPALQKLRYRLLKICFSRPGREQDRVKAAKAFRRLHDKLEASKSASTGTLLLKKRVQTMLWQYEHVPLAEEDGSDDDGLTPFDDDEDADDGERGSETSELVDYKGLVVRPMTEPIARQLDAAGAAAQANRSRQHTCLPPVDEHQVLAPFGNVQIQESDPSQLAVGRSDRRLEEQHRADCRASSCYSRSEHSLERTSTGGLEPFVSLESPQKVVMNPYTNETGSGGTGQPEHQGDDDSGGHLVPFVPARSQWRIQR